MRRTLALAAIAGCALVWVGSSGDSAQADTLTFASGIEANGSDRTCVAWSEADGSVGLTIDSNAEHCHRHYSVPLYWRTFPSNSASLNRSVKIRYRKSSSSASLVCDVFVYDSEGVPVVHPPAQEMPVTGANYGTHTINFTGVVSSGTSFVTCTQSSGNTWLLKIEWSP